MSYYWTDFYAKNLLKVAGFESSFAKIVPQYLNGSDYSFLEFGCGNFRDSYFLSQNGYEVTATDKAEVQNIVPDAKIKFVQKDLYEANLEEFIETLLPRHEGKKNAVYARFFLHSIDEEAQLKLANAIKNSPTIDHVFLEFRTLKDAELSKVFGTDHDRFFVDFDKIRDVFNGSGNFKELLAIESRGLAPYKDEDPFIGRLIFERIG